MIVYFSHSRKVLGWEKIIDVVRRVLREKLALKLFLPYEGREKPIDSRQAIKKSDILLAEVSTPGTGIGVEVGWADAFSKEIVFLAREGTDPSGSLKLVSNNWIFYNDLEDLGVKLEKFFSKKKLK